MNKTLRHADRHARTRLARCAALVSMLCVSGTIGCSATGELNRSQASALIGSSQQFKTPAFEQVFLGADYRSVDFIGAGNWVVVDALLSSGYLEKQGGEINLTAKGEAACKDSPRDPERENARSFPVAHREFVEVSGITDAAIAGPGVKEVRFTWRWSPTALGKELLPSIPKLASTYSGEQSREGTALFRLYDDGWRLEEVQFGDLM